jgi:exodeoxyribonuclease V beta subunit
MSAQAPDAFGGQAGAMPAMPATPAPSAAPQVQPLDVLNCPLEGCQLIEASAGTGKTFAICALVLRGVLERGWLPRQVLVVTFTTAATAELKQRVRERLEQARQHLHALPAGSGSGADDLLRTLVQRLHEQGLSTGVMQQRVLQALEGFDEAAILTIHGFCQRALADSAFSAGMPLNLEATPGSSPWRLPVVHDFWCEHIVQPQLPKTVAAHLLACGDSPQRWAQWLGKHLAQPLSRLRWPDAEPGLSDRSAAVQQAHQAAAALWAAEHQKLLRRLQDHLPHLNKNKGYKPEELPDIVAAAQAWLAGPALAVAARSQAQDEPHKALALWGTRALQAAQKKGTPAMPTHAFHDAIDTLLQAHEQHTRWCEQTRWDLVRRLLAEGPGAMQAAETQARVIGFDSMLFHLHQRLLDPAAAAQGRGQVDAQVDVQVNAQAGAQALAERLVQARPIALIDEFQDTDPLQWQIFSHLYRRANKPLFLVGDPKQAIYGFRGADLHTLLAARAQADTVHTLQHNQRSSAALLQALNALWGRQAAPFVLPELAYREALPGSKPRPPSLCKREPCRWCAPVWAQRRTFPTSAKRATWLRVAWPTRCCACCKQARPGASRWRAGAWRAATWP